MQLRYGATVLGLAGCLLMGCGSSHSTEVKNSAALPDCEQSVTTTTFADVGLSGTFRETGQGQYELDIKNTSSTPVRIARSQLVNMFAVSPEGKLESRHLDYAVGSPDLPLAPGETFTQRAIIDPYDCKNMKLPAGTYDFVVEVLLADAKSAVSPMISVTLQ